MADPLTPPSAGRLLVALLLAALGPALLLAIGDSLLSGTSQRILPTFVVFGAMALLLVALLGLPILLWLRGRRTGLVPTMLVGAGLAILPALAGHGLDLPPHPAWLLAPMAVAGSFGGALLWLVAIRRKCKGRTSP
jgi:hypothetical protein